MLLFYAIESCRMIVPICRSNGFPQQISLAADIPGEVHAGGHNGPCPRQGEPAPPPPKRHKVAMTYVHLVLGFSSTISMNEDAILGGGFERLSDAPRDSKFQLSNAVFCSLN